MDKGYINSAQSNQANEINGLIGDLSNQKISIREAARNKLADIGRPAIIPLLNLLQSPDKWLHWEAAKALAEMRETSAAPILVDFLTHRDSNIRWLAAEGLIALGSSGLQPLLEVLTHYSGSYILAEGAHHILRDLYMGQVHEGERDYLPLNPLTEEMKSLIKPVLDNILESGSIMLIPEYAKTALFDLKRIEEKSK